MSIRGSSDRSATHRRGQWAIDITHFTSDSKVFPFTREYHLLFERRWGVYCVRSSERNLWLGECRETAVSSILKNRRLKSLQVEQEQTCKTR